jgi:hypothetical protein
MCRTLSSLRSFFLQIGFKPKSAALAMSLGLLSSLASLAQTVIISPTGDGGFENGATFAANGWSVDNGSAPNQWFVGSVPVDFATNAAYISNDGGITNAYSNTAPSVVHFWRDITLPAGETEVTLSFTWQVRGETGFYDAVMIGLAPTTYTPTASTTSLSTGTLGDPVTYVDAVWSTGTITAPATYTLTFSSAAAGNCDAPATVRLIFTWKNDTSAGNPPVAIDDISLTSSIPTAALVPGTYTINNTLATGGTNFNNFTDAIQALNNISGCGSGGYVFNVAAGQTFIEDAPMITASGTATNTIIFQKDGAGVNPVITPTGTAATNDFGIGINGGDYITFDGIDINVGASTAVEFGYFLRNATATDGANNNTIRNAKVTMNNANTASKGVLVSASTLAANGTAITATSQDGANNNNLIENLVIESVGIHGIMVISGSTTVFGIGNQIIGNTIGTTYTGAPTGNGGGIEADFQQDLVIDGNTIRNIASSTTTDKVGIDVIDAMGTTRVSNNIIYGIRSNNTTGTSTEAVGIQVDGDSDGATIHVFNNFVSDITSAHTTTSANRFIYGMRTVLGDADVTYIFDYNNVSINANTHLADPQIPSNASSVALDLASATSVNIVRNNNLANFTTDQFGNAIHYVIESGSATGIGAAGSISDYNNLYLANTVNGHIGLGSSTPFTTLAAWTAATGQDANSISVDPQYVDPQFDLHVTNMALAGEAMPGAIPGTLADIDGNFRPDPATIGAHELAPVAVCSGTPDAGTIDAPATVCTGADFSMTVSGATVGDGMSYQWQMSTDGATGPWTNVGTGAIGLTTTFTGLVWYQFVATCANSGLSSTSSVVSITASEFYVCYCSANLGGSTSTTYCPSYITFGSIDNQSPNCVAPFYTLYPQDPGLTGQFAQGVSYTLSVATGGSSEVSAWVDYDRDGVFEVDEFTAVYTTGSSGTVQVAIPLTAQLGLTGFRIRTSSTTIDGAGAACNTITTGSTHDFVIEIISAPACFPVTNLAVSSVGANSATLTWTCDGCTGEFYVEVGADGFTPGTGATAGGGTVSGPFTTNTATISGLTPGMAYDVYVRQDCNVDGFSVNMGPESITTLQLISAFPFCETFNGLSGCYDSSDCDDVTCDLSSGSSFTNSTADLGDWYVASSTVSSGTGPTGDNPNGPSNGAGMALVMESSAACPSTIDAFSPVLDVTSLTNGVLVTMAYHMFGDDMGTLQIDVEESNAPGTWTTLWSLSGNQGDQWLSIPIIYQPTSSQIRFRVRGTYGSGFESDMAFDDFCVSNAPACLPVSDVLASNITPYSADVGFTANASDSYNYEVRTSGAPGSGPAGLVFSGNTTSSPINLVDLTPGTEYTVYIQSQCAGEDPSFWTVPVSFTTPCGIFNIPFVQSFDGLPVNTTAPTLPNCWSAIDLSPTSPTSGVTSSWNAANAPTSTSYNGLLNGQVMQYVGTSTHQADDYLITPGIQLTGGVSYQLNYDLGHSSSSSSTNMTVRYGSGADVSGQTEVIFAHPTSNTLTAASYEFHFTPPTDGVYYLSWHATWVSGSGSFYLDDVSIVPSPICATVNISATDDCANDQFSILAAIPSLGDATGVDLTYTLNYGTPVVITGLTGDTLLGPFTDTDIVQISTMDGLANCGVIDHGYFYADCIIEIDCNATQALTLPYCYTNNDPRVFTFVASDPLSTLDLKFLQPSPIAPGDGIGLYSGMPGNNQLPAIFFNDDLSTLGVITTSNDSLSITIQADATNSCYDGGVSGNWNFQVRCSGCLEPAGDVFLVQDCATQSFNASLDVYDPGFNAVTGNPASTVSISYTVNGGTPSLIEDVPLGFYDLGDHPLGAILNISILHENDGSCDNLLGDFTVPVTACPNDEPCQARPLTMNPNYTCVATTPGDLTGMTATGTTTTCTGTPNDDVWYSFVATAPTHRIQILNVTPTTSMNHSLFTGACDGTLTLVAGSCATTATSNPTGLTIGQTYLVRVHSAGGVDVTTTFDVCVSAPPDVDMRASALASPPAVGCYGPDQTVTITITNNSWLPIDFSIDPVTVNASTTGGYSSSTVVSSGTLAAGASMDVVMPDLIDMSVAGTYTFNANTLTANDGNTANDAMASTDRVRVAPTALPITNDFNSYGGTVTSLGTGWNEAIGDLAPSGTTSSWTASASAEDTHPGFGATNHAKIAMTGTAQENDWIVTPKFMVQLGTSVDFVIGLSLNGTSTNSPAINTNGTQGMQGTDDEVIVRGSIDCGVTWFDIYSINASNTVGLTNVFEPRSVDLTAWAGEEMIIGFFAKRTSTSSNAAATAGSYDFHLDNVNIQVGAVCSGTPVAGTASSSVAGPVCAPGSTTLSVTGQSTDGGIEINWYSSTSGVGPFVAIDGANTNPYTASGLTETTYFQAWVKCTLTNDSVATNIVSTVITPTPTASASNDGPVCVGGDVQLTGTTDIGTTFSWTGPNSFNSTDQNPSITDISLAGSGVYTFIATANGCASTPATTNVSVESAPSIDSISADPIAVCNGGTSQLEVVATAALPNMLITEVTLFSSTGDGATPSYPPQLSGTDLDLVELNNASSVPADISGWELTVHPTNSTTVSHEIVFPAGTIVPPNGVVVVHLETTGTTDPANLFFVTGESTSYSSGSALGVVLRNGSTIVDAVGVNTYTFAAGTGVTAADWSGSAPAPSGDAGTTRTGASDTNTGADWTASEFAQQSIGTYNSGYTNPNSGTIGSYSWTPSDVLNDATIANPVASNLTATTTFVVVVSTTAGCTSTDSVTVSVGTPLIVDATSMADTICAGEEVILSSAVSGGGEPYSYSWSPGGATTAEITATPSTTTEFFLTVTDACGVVVTDSVTVVVEPTPTASATATDVQLCAGEALELIGATDIGTVYSWTGPNAFVSTELSPIIPGAGVAASGVYTFIATLGDCASAPATVSIAVDPAPTGVTATATPNPVCAGATVDLSATGIIPAVTIFSEDFEAATNSWTTENLSTGGSSPAAAAWTLRQSPFTAAAQNISSNDASQFYFTDSDAQGSGGTTNTSLTSPAIDLTGYVSADLSFHHYYRHLGSGATGSLATVQVSTDGTNFTDLVVYSSTQGTAASFLNPSIDLDAYVGQATVYIRFKFTGTWDYYWAVDNVNISGGNVPTFAWSSDPAGFASSEQDPTDVVVNEETTFTVMVSGPNGCSTSASVLVTMNTADTDGDTVLDCDDTCPTLFGQNGDACDPGPGFMNGVITDCQCVGEEIYVEVTSSVFLDGAYVAADGLMRDDLRSNGYIPATQPYGVAPWSYAGTESIGAGVLTTTGADAIVDWVLLELRDDTTNTLVIARRAALVQRDGDIVDMDGLSPVKFDEVMPANYYLAVRHRNHLGVMTAATYALSQIPTDIDLTVSTTTTFGTNARRSVAGTFPAMTMWTGNANSNTLVNYSGSANDRTAILNFLGAATFLTPQTGYNSQDVNMNGVVTYSGSNNDRTTLLNSLGASTFLTPIVEQLP